MSPEEMAAERRVQSYCLQWQGAKGHKQIRETWALFIRAINERNALRSPERIAEIERERGLRC